MFFYIFLILGIWRGVIGSEDLCDEPPRMACEKPHDVDFPKTEEEINRLCPKYLQLFDCLKDYSDTCGYNGDMTEERLQAMKGVVEDSCREDSALHAGIVQNIGCFGEVIEEDYEICYKYVGAMARKMENYIQDIEAERNYADDTFDEELWGSYECITQSLEIACFISKVSDRCGRDAKDVTTEVLTRASVTSQFCSIQSEEKLAELLSLLELELDNDSSLNRLFSKK